MAGLQAGVINNQTNAELAATLSNNATSDAIATAGYNAAAAAQLATAIQGTAAQGNVGLAWQELSTFGQALGQPAIAGTITGAGGTIAYPGGLGAFTGGASGANVTGNAPVSVNTPTASGTAWYYPGNSTVQGYGTMPSGGVRLKP